MASGNTGDYLDFAADVTCTWLSSDGGATWKDVLNFPAIYEVGDHGGIIVMASHQVCLRCPTKCLRMRCTSGLLVWYISNHMLCQLSVLKNTDYTVLNFIYRNFICRKSAPACLQQAFQAVIF